MKGPLSGHSNNGNPNQRGFLPAPSSIYSALPKILKIQKISFDHLSKAT